MEPPPLYNNCTLTPWSFSRASTLCCRRRAQNYLRASLLHFDRCRLRGLQERVPGVEFAHSTEGRRSLPRRGKENRHIPQLRDHALTPQDVHRASLKESAQVP